MEFSITIHEEAGVIETAVTGEMDRDAVIAMTAESGAAAREHGFGKLLFDLTGARTRMMTKDAFMLASNAEQRGIKKNDKRAIVMGGGSKEDYEFFENVSLNMGYIVQMFTDRDAAMSWLAE